MIKKAFALVIGSVCAQLDKSQQQRLTKIAENALKSSSVEDLAQAAQVLTNLNSISN